MFSEDIIRHKLKEIRLQKGITEEFAAISLGRSSNSSISRIESGQTRLNFEIVNKLCVLYGINPLDLFNKSRIGVVNQVIQQAPRKAYLDRLMYRADTEIAKEVALNIKELQPVLRKLGIVLAKIGKIPITVFDIDQNFNDNIFSNYNLAKKYAISFAHKLREYFGIGPHVVIDLQDLIWKSLHIPICGLELGNDIWGMYSRDRFENPLVIYSANARFQQRNIFTIAHELGHHFFYKDNLALDNGSSFFNTEDDIYEKVANKFAQELLVPMQSLREKFDENGLALVAEIKATHIVELSNYFRVSYQMMNYCLLEAQKISKEKYEELRLCALNSDGLFNDLGYDGARYFRPATSLKNKLEEVVLVAYRTKLISKLDTCSMLDLTTEELLKKV